VVALIALVALLGVGAITMVSTRAERSAAAQVRFSRVALYAAESGAAAGLEFLRTNVDVESVYSAFVSPNNAEIQSPSGIFGNNLQPGQAGHPFAAATSGLELAWYHVEILNNRSDPKFGEGLDDDATVVLRSTGHGPDGSVAVIEYEVSAPEDVVANICRNEYAQRGINARNDYLGLCSRTVELASGSLRTINVVNP
jgi:hypothetical protein